jgi:cell volume regulation protein A
LEATAAILTAQHVLLTGAIVLFAGSVCGRLASWGGVPDIAVFLLAGIVLGPAVSGVVNVPADSALNQLILLFGASYILFDGGATLRFAVLREVWITVLVLATAGVVITAVASGIAAHYLLGVPWIVAALLGAVIAPTDPATLVPVFRQIRVRERLAQTLISESAANDATGAILTFAVLAVAMHTGETSVGQALYALGYQALLGIVIGGVAGYLASVLIAHERLGFLQEYLPLVTLMAVIAGYLEASAVRASGFMAVFVAGVVVGNRELLGLRLAPSEAQRLDEFLQTTALIMRMFIFILLGAQVDFALLDRHLWGAVAVVAVLMLVARPLTALISALPDRRARWTMRELALIGWSRETGVIPSALAGMLIGLRAPGAEVIAAVVFTAVLITILIQATTTRWLARRLDLLAR